MKKELEEILEKEDPLFPYLERAIDKSRTLETIKNMSLNRFIEFLCKYQRFNNQFAPCVINLASKIHLHFYDLKMNAEGSEIASGIYKSCIHEYAEVFKGKEVTHGRLSQNFIEKLHSLYEIKETESPHEILVNSQVRNFYCNSGSLANRLGYHIGSEFLAAFEFSEINNFARKNFPDLYEKMNENGEWHWISIHSEVEIEHFKNAIESYKIFRKIFLETPVEDRYESWGTENLSSSVSAGFLAFEETQSEFLNIFTSDEG